jgi:hypothetical protein
MLLRTSAELSLCHKLLRTASEGGRRYQVSGYRLLSVAVGRLHSRHIVTSLWTMVQQDDITRMLHLPHDDSQLAIMSSVVCSKHSSAQFAQ